ncbi:Uncharacterized protein HSBGL_2350 [Halapricum desulfuricans]|uniref:Uncharacterized protein n=1 Tax=Halapricum desulfuricans TaxID=2841257 RepID=A0A897NMQ0_9EURY|nr:hypothetical protein [Halapricum desulfuricans]QSG12755.1 Uncharacterized protein HSBGL_2350 [Halapricum desulfuricans]
MDGFRRRDFLGATGATAGLALAGCLDRVPVLGAGAAPSVGPVPASATAFVTADVAALLDSGPLRDLLDDAVPATDIDGLAELVADRTGIDPRETRRAIGFATPADGVAGTVVDADWSRSELVSAIESQANAPTETTVEGRPGYAFEGVGLTVSTLEDGRHVAGIGGGVRAIVATAAGSNGAVRPAVRRAYGRVPAGPVRFAIDATAAGERTTDAITRDLPRFSRDVIDSIRFVAGSLSTVDGRPRVVLHVTGDDGTGARQLKEYAEAIPVLISQRVDDETIERALGEADITRDGTRVTITLEGSETIRPLVRAVFERALFAVFSVTGLSVEDLLA